jgi:uncharacterized protein with FMN-binding domain
MLKKCVKQEVKSMKKISVAVLSAVLTLTLAGCAAKTQNASSNSAGSSTYKDGTYSVKNKSTKPGFEEAVVTIKDGKIQNVDLKRLDDSSKEVNYEDWDGTKGGKPNLKQFRLDLAKAIVEKQSAQVDSITGATESSKGWMKAVSDALAQASK